MSATLEQLLGAAIQSAGAAVRKGFAINFRSVFSAVYNAATDAIDVGLSTLGMSHGWMLMYSVVTDGFVPVRGVRCIATGTVAINGVTPQTVTCTDIADGDAIVYTFKTAGGSAQYTCVTTDVSAGASFSCAGKASDTSTFNYMVLRAGNGPVA